MVFIFRLTQNQLKKRSKDIFIFLFLNWDSWFLNKNAGKEKRTDSENLCFYLQKNPFSASIFIFVFVRYNALKLMSICFFFFFNLCSLTVKTRKEAKQMATRESISATRARIQELQKSVLVQRARRDEYATIMSQLSLGIIIFLCQLIVNCSDADSITITVHFLFIVSLTNFIEKRFLQHRLCL